MRLLAIALTESDKRGLFFLATVVIQQIIVSSVKLATAVSSSKQ
ncbi:hypothetical protein COO91_04022 [Nostoc flagelliforme CCNUN1]|uniref:Uncharacterized protein n=1 Tax=Nostoc flagelliforme CCNUN1 TaxID=2038116 RepID=A0A2K8SRW4_9NOSO|nr:hypothetical protein COO91_04022 [Nostoc flagelliforme CCNUN1]